MGLKTSEGLNLLRCTASLNIDNIINLFNECADYFRELRLLQNYKIQLRLDAGPVAHYPRRFTIT